MIFTADDLRELVIRPTLKYLDNWNPAMENLLVGTAVQESGLGFSLRQGKMLGLYHISPATHRAVWDRHLVAFPELASRVRGMAGQHSFLEDPHGELLTNLKYATAIAWCVYQRVRQPLPEARDIEGLARFWHRHFRSRPSGRVTEFARNYRDLGQPHDRKLQVA